MSNSEMIEDDIMRKTQVGTPIFNIVHDLQVCSYWLAAIGNHFDIMSDELGCDSANQDLLGFSRGRLLRDIEILLSKEKR